MAAQKKIVADRQKARVGSRARLVVDGPSPEHEWVFTGRLPGQAPDIDPLVYLTEADPAAPCARTVPGGRNRRRQGYDLVARASGPLSLPDAKLKGPVLIWENQSGL